MALPSSGSLSFSQILTEFGAPVGTKLSQMHRGGAYVPDIPANAGVPTSGAISVRDFLGASNSAPLTVSAPDAFGDTATSGTINTAPSTVSVSGGSLPYTYAWSFVSGDVSVACLSPTASSTRFQADVGPANPDRSAVWRCTVTSADGQTAHDDMTATLSYVG